MGKGILSSGCIQLHPLKFTGSVFVPLFVCCYYPVTAHFRRSPFLSCADLRRAKNSTRADHGPLARLFGELGRPFAELRKSVRPGTGALPPLSPSVAHEARPRRRARVPTQRRRLDESRRGRRQRTRCTQPCSQDSNSRISIADISRGHQSPALLRTLTAGV